MGWTGNPDCTVAPERRLARRWGMGRAGEGLDEAELGTGGGADVPDKSDCAGGEYFAAVLSVLMLAGE